MYITCMYLFIVNIYNCYICTLYKCCLLACIVYRILPNNIIFDIYHYHSIYKIIWKYDMLINVCNIIEKNMSIYLKFFSFE